MSEVAIPPPQPQPTSQLLNRVASYSLVGRAQAVYNYAKEFSPQVIKTGVFGLAENVVSTVAQQPLFVKAVETAKLEERGTQLLDRFDSAVEKVNDLNRQRQELQSNVSGVVSTVSRAVYQPLDVALEVVDKYLPEEQLSEDDVAPLSKLAVEADVPESQLEDDADAVPPPPASSTQKLVKLSTKLQKAALTKFSALKLRSAEQLASMQFAINLIEYAKQNNLVEYAKDRIDAKTVAQVSDAVSQSVVTVQLTASAVKATVETVAVQTSIAVEQMKNVAKAKATALALRIDETQWKKQFDEIMGPYLKNLQTQSQRIAVISISAVAVAVDFTLQQFQLTKQREFGQVLSNIASVTAKAVEQSKTLTTEALVELEKAVDAVQQTLRKLVDQTSKLTVASSFQYLMELQIRLTAALKVVASHAPFALLVSPSSTA